MNVLFDFDYRDKRVDVDLSGLSFQEALDRLTFTNRLFYKVLDQNTIIIVPESPAKRRTYDEVLLQTFYLQNAEVKDVADGTVSTVKASGLRPFSTSSQASGVDTGAPARARAE